MESDFTTKEIISKEILLKAYNQMMLAKSMADVTKKTEIFASTYTVLLEATKPYN